MQEEIQGLENYLNSPDFKRKSTNITEDAAKMIGKWIGIGFKALIDFVKSMISMVTGK